VDNRKKEQKAQREIFQKTRRPARNSGLPATGRAPARPIKKHSHRRQEAPLLWQKKHSAPSILCQIDVNVRSPLPAVHQHPPVNHAPNLDLIRKYSMAAPRYTSYPPATRFTADFAPLDLADAIRADNAPGAGPLSLYFHLPFCETRCWYCGCTTIITRRAGAATDYLGLLEREIALTAGRIDTGRPVVQLHLGGGTPTFLQPGEIRRLAAMVRSRFEYAPDAEISVEIDPRRLTRDHIRALAELGATRASLGVQDTDRRVQLAIHRHQPNPLNQQAVAWLRA
jgi:oxygen-independent coproporphyrinogen-3 oxidase